PGSDPLPVLPEPLDTLAGYQGLVDQLLAPVHAGELGFDRDLLGEPALVLMQAPAQSLKVLEAYPHRPGLFRRGSGFIRPARGFQYRTHEGPGTLVLLDLRAPALEPRQPLDALAHLLHRLGQPVQVAQGLKLPLDLPEPVLSPIQPAPDLLQPAQ